MRHPADPASSKETAVTIAAEPAAHPSLGFFAPGDAFGLPAPPSALSQAVANACQEDRMVALLLSAPMRAAVGRLLRGMRYEDTAEVTWAAAAVARRDPMPGSDLLYPGLEKLLDHCMWLAEELFAADGVRGLSTAVARLRSQVGPAAAAFFGLAIVEMVSCHGYQDARLLRAWLSRLGVPARFADESATDAMLGIARTYRLSLECLAVDAAGAITLLDPKAGRDPRDCGCAPVEEAGQPLAAAG